MKKNKSKSKTIKCNFTGKYDPKRVYKEGDMVTTDTGTWYMLNQSKDGQPRI